MAGALDVGSGPVGTATLFPSRFLESGLAGLLPVQVLGVLLILAGDALFVWALISFGNSWRIGIDEKSAGALVTNGIFAFSRNPIFAFIDLYFLGTFLVSGAPIFLIFAVVTILGSALPDPARGKIPYRAGMARHIKITAGQVGRYVNLKAIQQRPG